MMMKFFCLAALVSLASCLTNDDPKKVERWYLESWEGELYCMLAGRPEEEEKNKIIETLLGLDDSANTETVLHLGSDGEMQILKNNVVALSGRWNNTERHVLTLAANDQFWNLEVVNQNKDSIVLRVKEYLYVAEVEMVFKSR